MTALVQMGPDGVFNRIEIGDGTGLRYEPFRLELYRNKRPVGKRGN